MNKNRARGIKSPEIKNENTASAAVYPKSEHWTEKLTRMMHDFFVGNGANGCQAWSLAGMSRAGPSLDTLSSENNEDGQEWRGVIDQFMHHPG